MKNNNYTETIEVQSTFNASLGEDEHNEELIKGTIRGKNMDS